MSQIRKNTPAARGYNDRDFVSISSFPIADNIGRFPCRHGVDFCMKPQRVQQFRLFTVFRIYVLHFILILILYARWFMAITLNTFPKRNSDLFLEIMFFSTFFIVIFLFLRHVNGKRKHIQNGSIFTVPYNKPWKKRKTPFEKNEKLT